MSLFIRKINLQKPLALTLVRRPETVSVFSPESVAGERRDWPFRLPGPRRGKRVFSHRGRREGTGEAFTPASAMRAHVHRHHHCHAWVGTWWMRGVGPGQKGRLGSWHGHGGPRPPVVTLSSDREYDVPCIESRFPSAPWEGETVAPVLRSTSSFSCVTPWIFIKLLITGECWVTKENIWNPSVCGR